MHKPRATAVPLSSTISIPENSLKVMNRLKQSDKNNSSLPTGIKCPHNTVHGPCNSPQHSATRNFCRGKLNLSPMMVSYVVFPIVLPGAGLPVWGKNPGFLHHIPALNFNESPSRWRLSRRLFGKAAAKKIVIYPSLHSKGSYISNQYVAGATTPQEFTPCCCRVRLLLFF